MIELDSSGLRELPELRRVYGSFPSGVVAVCAAGDDSTPMGIAMSSFTSVSMDPPLVSVCVARTSKTWAALAEHTHLGLSVLSSNQGLACRQLAAKNAADRFSGIHWHSTPNGAVLLEDAVAWLECTVDKTVDAGDHILLILEVRAFQVHHPAAPLVFHGSAFHHLSSIPESVRTA